MTKHKNVRIEEVLLDKIDGLHSKSFNRQMMVNLLLETSVTLWEEWLVATGEIEVCKVHRAGEYMPIFNGYEKTFPYSKELLEKQAETMRSYDT